MASKDLLTYHFNCCRRFRVCVSNIIIENDILKKWTTVTRRESKDLLFIRTDEVVSWCGKVFFEPGIPA